MACWVMQSYIPINRALATPSIGEHGADVLAEDLAYAGAYDTGAARHVQVPGSWPVVSRSLWLLEHAYGRFELAGRV